MRVLKLSETREASTFGSDVLNGLSSNPKRLSAKYFYDDRGSELFQKICLEPDYYLTRTEYSILESAAAILPSLIGRSGELDVIELGAGDGHKTKLLLDGFARQGIGVAYYPIDISAKAMGLLERNISESSGIRVTGIVADYFSGLAHLRSISRNPKLVLFLGSNVGNLDPPQSIEFLRRLWHSMAAEDLLLIGFDQKKSVEVLNRAYNDSSGLTREFNLNVLSRINRELGGEFDLRKFEHYGYYNPLQGAMESHLVSLEEQEVRIGELERSFPFGRYEPWHLEYSFKFTPSEIEGLSRLTGFTVVRDFSDDRRYFTDALWKVAKAA